MDTIWVSKYALTSGIKRCEWDGQISEHGYVFPNGMCMAAKLGIDAHRTEAEAKTAAERMRRRKIASLKKSIQKFDDLRFDRLT